MSMQVKKSVHFSADQITALRSLLQGVYWAEDNGGKRNFYVNKAEAQIANELSSLMKGCDSLYMSLRTTESE